MSWGTPLIFAFGLTAQAASPDREQAYTMNRECIAAVRGVVPRDEAVATCRSAVRLLESVFGEHHEMTVYAYLNLGSALLDAGDIAGAEVQMGTALSRAEGTFDDVDPDWADVERAYAGLLYELGKYREAASLLTRALQRAERAHGEISATAAMIGNDLGLALLEIDRVDEAAAVLQRALEVERALEPRKPRLRSTIHNNLGLVASSQGRLADARSHHEESVRLTVEHYGASHPILGLRIGNLGWTYAREGRYEEAEPLIRRALEVQRATLPPGHPDIANTLTNLAGVMTQLARFDEATSVYRDALAASEAARGPDHPALMPLLRDYASHLGKLGRHHEALELARRVVRIAEANFGEQSTAMADALNSLAAQTNRAGNRDAALEGFQRVLAIREAVLGPDHPDTAIALHNVATTLGDARYADAEEGLRRALALGEEALGPDHSSVATRAGVLGDLLVDTGRYAEAEALYRRALAIKEARHGSDHPAVVPRLEKLARLLDETGRQAEAEPLLRKALAITEQAYGPDHPSLVDPLSQLGLVLLDLDREDEAASIHRRALTISEQTWGVEHENVISPLTNLARANLERGRTHEARDQYSRALILAERFPNIVRDGIIAGHYSDVLLRENRLSEAREVLQERLDALDAVGRSEHPVVANLLRHLWPLLVQAGELQGALAFEERALRTEEADLRQNLMIGDFAQRAARMAQMEVTTNRAISLFLDWLPDSGPARDMALQAVLNRKGRLPELERSTLQLVREHEDDAGIALLDELRDLRAKMGARDQPLEEELQARVEAIEFELSTRSAAFAEVSAPITIDDVVGWLPRRHALLELYVYRRIDFDRNLSSRRRYLAFVVTSDGAVATADLGEAEALDELAWQLRGDLLARRSLSADRLHEAVLGPLHEALRGVRHVYVAADGLLSLLPFEVLVEAEPRAPTISYLTSGRDLRPRPQQAPRSAPVVVYGVDYDLAPEGAESIAGWSPLPGARAEGERILAELPDAEALTGVQATEAALKGLRGPVLLHVASHGYFETTSADGKRDGTRSGRLSGQPALSSHDGPWGSSMMRSGLVLAGANFASAGDDGRLTAAEVATVDLRGTRLVTLSACETGVGEVRNGDGVHGLRRALALAGSEAQLLSLWRVDDQATTLLMTRFYRELVRGRSARDALLRARAAVRRREGWSHPFYWAAFTLSGHDQFRL